MRPLLLRLFVLACFLGQMMAQEQQQQQEQQQTQEATPPEPPPRVVGQAQTQQEFDDYQAISSALNDAQKLSLATQFLTSYPDSGLTAYVHQILAQQYDAAGDVLNFMIHGDEALKELPDNAPILTRMAFISAEQGQSGESIVVRAQRALRALENLAMPGDAEAATWVDQKMQLQADANYAIGRAYLNRFTSLNLSENERSASPDLKLAITHFQQAIEKDPRHDYAYFRLGFAETNADNAETAVDAYAGAVATGGVAAGPAQGRLEQLHAFIRENMQDSELASQSVEEIVQDRAARYQEQLAANQQERARQTEEIRQKALAARPAVTPPPTIPPPPVQ